MAWVEQSGKTSFRVRFVKPDGTLGSEPGFPTRAAANTRANLLEAEKATGTFADRSGGQTLFAAWTDTWLVNVCDVDVRTEAEYRSKIRNHLLPQWGGTPLREITASSVTGWAKSLRGKGLADTTVKDIVKLFCLIVEDAVEEKLLTASPIPRRRKRRGRRMPTTPVREKVWATPEQVLRICDQAALVYGTAGAVLLATAAYTGARWGELVGLQRHNLNLDEGWLRVDPRTGSLHESSDGRLWLGPPKTPGSARTIALPPFLLPILAGYLDSHDHRHVFVTPDHGLHYRGNFRKRCTVPAAWGHPNATKPVLRTRPVCPGLTVHGLGHGHKTWMIADAIPDVAQARRLGHKLPHRIDDIYSHVADEVEHRLLVALQNRWATGLGGPDGGQPVPEWRRATPPAMAL